MKKTTKMALMSLCLIILPSLCLANFKPDDVLGIWYTKDNKAKIEIFKTNNKYHGKIIWLKNPNYPNGKQKIDRENPDEKLRSRPVVGIVNLEGFVFDEDEYEDGTIYDPNNGKTYSCYMKLTGMNTLEVRGYIGISLIGRTEVWNRVK